MFNLLVLKWWHFRYRFNGAAKMLSMGIYPEVSLKNARNEHKRLKELLAQGINPSQHRQEQKQQEALAASNSFEAVARLWWENWRATKSERHTYYVCAG